MLKVLTSNKYKESLIVAIIVSIVILYFHFTLPKFVFDNYKNEFAWDILSYYLYLPLTFIHHDLGIHDYTYITHIFEQYNFSPNFYQAAQMPNPENGNWIMIYTCGMAILYLPFFIIGHLWASSGGYVADGFSYPYQFCISTGTMLYIILGIFIMRKILLHFFSDRIVSIVLIMLLLGTNYFREASDYNMGPHAILFTFYSILIYYTIKWHEHPKPKYAGIIGVAVGFLTLIRPTELISILIPLLWTIHNKKSFFDKIVLLKKNASHLFVLFIVIILVGLPQMLYWKIYTGSWLYNSYWNQHSFDISESHFMQVFFSIRKGWLVYSPAIIFAFAGFFFLKKNELVKIRLAALAFILINIFLITHVPIWWNAGSFGQRFMVQSYAVLAIPLGAFFQFISEKKLFVRLSLGTICFLMLSLNLFQTWQFVNWIIPGDGMTLAYYKKSFLKTSYMTKEDQLLLDLQRSFDPNEKFNDQDPTYKKKTISYFDMDDVNTDEIDVSQTDTTYALSGKHSYKLSQQSAYSPGLSKPFCEITKKDFAWIRFTIWYFPVSEMKEASADLVIHFIHDGKTYGYYGYHIADNPYKLNQWNKYSVDYLTPGLSSDEDEMKAYIWFTGNKELYIDNIQIEAFEKR